MGLGLVLAALFPKGGALAVESPGNPGIQEVCHQRPGLRLVGIPVDAQGMDMEALEAAVVEQDLRAVLVTPHAQQPMGVTLSAPRRARLVALAQEHRLAILEEDSDGEHHYDGRRPKPLAASDAFGQVIHLGSLSRLVAPELRIGFTVCSKNLASRLARVRQRMESHGDPALEWALGDLMRDGLLDSHLLRVRRVYLERRDLLAAHLRDLAGAPFAFEVPPAGLGIWLKAEDPAAFEDWLARARSRGVHLEAGAHFTADGQPLAATRMGFGSLDAVEMAEAFGLLKTR
jgi:GntR family transcriptional regulator/MocR family aminotransferase